MAGVVTTTSAPGPLLRARRWASGFREAETWAAFSFLSPWLFGFVVFTAGPMVASAVLSFTDYSVIQTTHNVGFDNYRELYHDPKVASSLKVTLIYTVMVVPVHMVVSVALALLLSKVGRLSGVFRTFFYLLIFNGDFGVLNAGLSHLGITGPFWLSDPAWVKPGLVIMHIWAVGSSVVILLAALMGVPQHLHEAAAIDGASTWRRFRDVTVPMISPALFFIVIINTIAALQTFDQVYTARAHV